MNDPATATIDVSDILPNNAHMAATENTPPNASFPSPRDVLKWCAAAHPEMWFPSECAEGTGTPRDQLNAPLWVLRQAGLVKVVDWVRGKGQGFALTPAGEVALTEPGLIPVEAPRQTVLRDDVPPAEPATPDERDTELAESTTFERGEQAREAVLGRKRVAVTPILIAVNVAWFLLGGVAAWRMDITNAEYLRGESTEAVFRIGAVSGLSLLDGQWWRLLSAGFVHIGILHLLANMIGLLILGPMAEMMWGRKRFLLIYLLAGTSANCLAMAWEPNSVLAGASGSIWGMMTAILVWVVRVRVHLPASGEMQSLLRGLVTVLLINFVASAAPGVSWQGHFGGGLAGIAMAFLLEPLRGRRRTPAHRTLVLAGLTVLACAGPFGLILASRQTSDWLKLRTAHTLRERLAVEPVRWQRVKDTYTQVTTALVRQSPDALRNAEVTVKRLGTDVESAREQLVRLGGAVSDATSQAGADYLHQLDQLTARMRDALAEKRVPSEAEWKTLAAERDATEAAWNRIPSPIIPPSTAPAN